MLELELQEWRCHRSKSGYLVTQDEAELHEKQGPFLPGIVGCEGKKFMHATRCYQPPLMDIHVGLAALHPETVQAKVTLKATWLSWEQACDLGRRACCVRWM